MAFNIKDILPGIGITVDLAKRQSGLNLQAAETSAIRQKMSLADLSEQRTQAKFEQQQEQQQQQQKLESEQAKLSLAGKAAGAIKSLPDSQKLEAIDLAKEELNKALPGAGDLLNVRSLNFLAEATLSPKERRDLKRQSRAVSVQEGQLGLATERFGFEQEQAGLENIRADRLVGVQEGRLGLEGERLDLSREQVQTQSQQFQDRLDFEREQSQLEARRKDNEFKLKLAQFDEGTRQFEQTFDADKLNSAEAFALKRAKLIADSTKSPSFNSDMGKLVQDLQTAQASGNAEAVSLIQSELKDKQRERGHQIIKSGESSRYSKLVKDSDSAAVQLTTFSQMKELLENTDTGLQTSVTLPVNRALGAIGSLFGVAVPEGLGDQEALNALFTTGVLDAASSLSGPKSDNDIKFLKASAPGLSKSKEGNLLLIQFAESIAKRKIDLEQYVSDQLYKGESNTVAEARNKWIRLNDEPILSPSMRARVEQMSESGSRKGDRVSELRKIIGL